MKKFEKWNENFEGEPPPPIEPGLDCGDCLDYYKKETWKAVLEWIKKINSNEAYNNIDQAIYEELKEIKNETNATKTGN